MAKKRPKSPKGRKPLPRCKAILLCDQVIIDAITRKNSLIGIFETFFVPHFPGNSSTFTAFLQLVDGIGKYDLHIEIHDLQQNSVIARMGPFPIEFPERVNKAVFMFTILPFPLPHAGSYDFVVTADGEDIDRQKFDVQQFQLPQPPGEQPHDEDQ